MKNKKNLKREMVNYSYALQTVVFYGVQYIGKHEIMILDYDN